MRRELRYAASGLRPRAITRLLAWSVLETLPTALFGLLVARAVDDGFLAGRPWTGAAWLGGLLLAAAVGAVGSRQVYAGLGALVEPFRDRLVRLVIGRAVGAAVAGRPEAGALSLLTRQVEIARDAYAGAVLSIRGCLVATVGVTIGLLALDGRLALLVLPLFGLGLLAFACTLGYAADRQREAAVADAALTDRVGEVVRAVRDLAACGGEAHGASLAARPIEAQAAAERALARAAALRSVCFAIGGWLPLLAILAAAPALTDSGVSAGAITGALFYVLTGLQPALTALVSGLGGSGLRLYVALSRILSREPVTSARGAKPASIGEGSVLSARGLTFAYGPHAAPAVRDLDVAVMDGDHLAVIGPSGIGKSTLAALLCGTLRPDAGTVAYGGADAAGLSARELARRRVLIPQEAYVFTGTVRANLAYLRRDADDAAVLASAEAVGALALVDRLCGLDAEVDPGRLSAGERQLVALARAHLSPAPIAILDEATSHLDPAAERRAEAAFRARGALVVIAHRPGSALRAERIMVMDGQSALVGDRESLREASELFREFLAHWGEEPVQIQPAS
ncbi:ATP-binding cassette domain-containing protein [Glycomyces harbinensis]|uniref:ATP-binding cassette, subfamily C n=1 Tax=Glycomyces harbinensis TaxID=58114 RepID=A0A1G6RKY6_9ACTN|nr:ABC transporter ATP-binding protein [Glycomyces harbinensis]SDD04655.1 ATP-binding cassette, subfamily C [Glycomyces harbinensis]